MHFPVLAETPQLHKIEPIKPNEVHLSWTSVEMKYCETLQFSLEYRSEHDKPDKWIKHIITNEDSTQTVHHYELTNLTPFTNYNVSLRATSKLSNDSFWSDAFNQTFQTIASEPACSPNLTVGAFEMYTGNKTNDILNIVWTELAARYRNGPNVQYRLDVNDTDYHCQTLSQQTGLCSRQVAGLHDRALTIQLFSVGVNNEPAKHASVMYIPSAVDRLPLPLRLCEIVLAEDQHPVFAWHPPDGRTTIVSYSLFWCRSIDAKECSGNLQSVVIDAAHTNYTPAGDHQWPGLMRFAVAANTLHSTSGMTWNHCRYERDMWFKVSQNVHDEQLTLTFDDLCLGCFTSISMLFCESGVHPVVNCKSFKLPITATTGQQFTTGALRANTNYTVGVNGTLLHSGRTVPFSEPFEVSIGRKAADDDAFVMAVAFAGAGVLVVILILLGGLKFVLNRVRDMQDIDVILPEALANITIDLPKRADMRPESIYSEQCERLLRKIAPVTDVTAVADDLTCDKLHPEVEVVEAAELEVLANGYIRYRTSAIALANPRPTSAAPTRASNNWGYVTVESMSQHNDLSSRRQISQE